MIIEYGSADFKKEWLEYVQEDPVHPSIPLESRIKGTRTILAHLEDDAAEPHTIICVKFGDKLPQNMEFIMSDDDATEMMDDTYMFTIFYSIFRLEHSTLKGAGAIAIKQAKEYYKKMGIKRFFTLSPIPSLRKDFKYIPAERAIKKYLNEGTSSVAKFHLSNGAKIHAIHYNADMSPQRIFESWGIMVNYDYCDYM